MNKAELAKKLAEMTRSMEEARIMRSKNTQKIYRRTNRKSLEALKKVLNYKEPPKN